MHGFWEPGLALREQRATVVAGTMGGDKYLRQRYSRPWYEMYDGDKPVIVGHHDHLRNSQPFIYQERVFGLDTGCCNGGALTGLILPNFRIVSVPSRANYWAEARAQCRSS